MRDALRQIEGVDEKFLSRPEVERLLVGLEVGEVPGAVVTNGRLSIAVATDRRILDIHKSRWSSSISKFGSHPYAKIESITEGRRLEPLRIRIGGKDLKVWGGHSQRRAFAEYVSARLPAFAATVEKTRQEEKLPPPASGKTELSRASGWFNLNVVGVSHYQSAIKHAERSADIDDRGNRFVKVRLRREPGNRQDSNAVSVLSPAGKVMGYLARGTAQWYAPALDALDKAGFYVTCSATMGEGDHGYGVQLDLKDTSALRVPQTERPDLVAAGKPVIRLCTCGRKKYDAAKYARCEECFQDTLPV